MAAKKKAKRKVKPKRKKARAKPKKAKAPRKRASAKKAKPRKAKAAAKRKPAKPVEPPPPGQRIGFVTHYFGEPSVAVIKLERGSWRIGDTIPIRGQARCVNSRRFIREFVGTSAETGLRLRHAPREPHGRRASG